MSYVGGEVENIQSKILEDLLQTEIGELFEYDLIKELISLAKYELAVVSWNIIFFVQLNQLLVDVQSTVSSLHWWTLTWLLSTSQSKNDHIVRSRGV